MKLSGVASSVAALLLSTGTFAAPAKEESHKRATASLTTDGASLNGQSFDYVIVGGGTAGMAAAYQLSKNKTKKILIIEAGSDTLQNEKVKQYSKYGQAFGDKTLDWNFVTLPHQSTGKRHHIHAGKGLGGSSTINGGVFSVPPSTQIDALGLLQKNDLSWSSFLPDLISYQNYHAPTSGQVSLGITFNQSAHGINGLVDLGFPTSMMKDPQEDAFVASVKSSLNVSKARDLGSGVVYGSAYLAKYVKPGPDTDNIRVSAATAFYTPLQQTASNVVTLINARATKILWQSRASPAVASGVEYQTDQLGPTFSVKTSQVIVAAGTIRSPKLLELSGIGSKTVLDSNGIETVVELPGVGANLIEQQKNDIVVGPPKDSSDAPDGIDTMVAFPTIYNLMKNASSVKTYMQSNIDSWAQAAVNSGGSVSKQGLLSQYNTMINGIFDNHWPLAELYFVPAADQVMSQAWNLMTFSRGSTHITSNSTWQKSNVDPAYFSHSIDMDFQVAAMRGLRKTFKDVAFSNVLASGESRPGFDSSNGGVPQSRGNHYSLWKSYILDNFESVWHVIGTCAMMPQNLGGVVGSDFKVYQTANVFVIDASVIPMPLSTHYVSVVYAMATRAARIIGGQS